MFKKIVSQLSFSPALVGQLGFYARRLRKEQTTRRLGLVFVVLALVVQSLTVFQPPEAANAAPTPPSQAALNVAKVETLKSATNVSQGNLNATTITAQGSDRITFTIIAKNTGGQTATDFVFKDNIGDTLEYSKLIDTGGGTYDGNTQTLSWPTIDLASGEIQVRTFSVEILATIPATPQGLSNSNSYNCKIENNFYTSSLILAVSCPAPKVIEQIVPQLPQIGTGENIAFAIAIFAVVLFFYLRSRQLGTEVRHIRRDVNGGTI